MIAGVLTMVTTQEVCIKVYGMNKNCWSGGWHTELVS